MPRVTIEVRQELLDANYRLALGERRPPRYHLSFLLEDAIRRTVRQAERREQPQPWTAALRSVHVR